MVVIILTTTQKGCAPVFPGIGISIINIRWSRGRLIFIMGIPILVRRYIYIENAPRYFWRISDVQLEVATSNSTLHEMNAHELQLIIFTNNCRNECVNPSRKCDQKCFVYIYGFFSLMCLLHEFYYPFFFPLPMCNPLIILNGYFASLKLYLVSKEMTFTEWFPTRDEYRGSSPCNELCYD